MKFILTSTFLFIFTFNISAQGIADFDDATIYFSGIFGVTSTLDEYGNVFLDMATSSDTDTQYKFRITDVNITMEESTDTPPIVLIDFECRKTECVYDPFNSPPTQTGSVTFDDVKRGKKAYNFLISLQEFIKNN